ncbi:MAG TPA: alpha/beta fold hydrolase [Pyrinomonadaceae bacterium]|nr:alpha/beta fold hydrolase [Pyrinomonadaceae bacterium]
MPGKKLLKMLLPIAGVLLLAVALVMWWLVYKVTRPPAQDYLVTPETFTLLSERGLKATNEEWTNRDGTRARGWLLRGAEGAPAVILLHRYGANRSWLLNLGVKLNETTNYTVLWPDLRGHGVEPPVAWTSFGEKETEDLGAALDYLRSLKTPQQRPLVGQTIGLYGVELGAYVALRAGARDANVRAFILDSVPDSPDDILNVAVRERTGLSNGLLRWLARRGTRIYFMGGYDAPRACEAAQSIGDRRVLLLAGGDTPPELRASSAALAQCFPKTAALEVKTDLPLTGYNLPFAQGEPGETYDRRVIDFFDRALRAGP